MSPDAAIPLPIALERGEVLRFLGYPAGREPAPGRAAAFAAALDDARALIEARGTYRRLPAARATETGLPPPPGGAPVAAVVLGLVTAGARLETRGAELAAAGRVGDALLLDAAGSAAAEEAADRLCALVVADAPRGDGGTRVACRVSPGYGDWPLAAQRLLFELLAHDAVGVELLPSLMMRPRKSVSFAMWLGADGAPVPGLSGCGHCRLERCAFRIRSPR